MKHVDIFTDGACSGNPGPGGWGAVLRYKGKEKELSGGEAETTNNRMEIMAVIEALKALHEPCEVTLTSDSQYVCNAIVKGWAKKWKQNNWIESDKTKAKNSELWDELDRIPIDGAHHVVVGAMRPARNVSGGGIVAVVATMGD